MSTETRKGRRRKAGRRRGRRDNEDFRRTKAEGLRQDTTGKRLERRNTERDGRRNRQSHRSNQTTRTEIPRTEPQDRRFRHPRPFPEHHPRKNRHRHHTNAKGRRRGQKDNGPNIPGSRQKPLQNPEQTPFRHNNQATGPIQEKKQHKKG